jgi:hypoxanthine phosphoribosyltransferase
MNKKTYISEEQYYRDMSELLLKVKQYSFHRRDTGVIAIYCGGLAPGQLIAYGLDLPLSIYFPGLNVVSSLFSLVPEFKTFPRKLLVVDDLIDTGNTVFNLVTRLKLYHSIDLTVIALYNKIIEGKLLDPDICVRDTCPDWIEFFYDKD